MNRLLKIAAFVLPCVVAGAARADTQVQIAFKLSNFSTPLSITNVFWPLAPGRHMVYSEIEGGECSVDDFVVTTSIKRNFQGKYAGLIARVVTDRTWLDKNCNGQRGLLLENTSDWYGQDNAGNVWYFGEDTVAYTYDDAGKLLSSSKEGAWEAGKLGAEAGLIMLARPEKGLFYQQEYSAGIAEDAAKVVKTNIPVTIGLGTFGDCISTRESTALAPNDVEYKDYCPNIGMVRSALSGNRGGSEATDLGLH